MTPQQGSEPWMPNGFPPPSFVVATERTSTFVGARRRWLAAAAILGALLLIAGVVFIANRGDDDKTALNTGSSTTAVGGTTPTFTSTTPLDPTATLPTATTAPGDGDGDGGGGGGGTTAPGGGGTTVAPGTTAPPAPGATPGVLAVSPGALTIATDPPSEQSGVVTLRNTGGSSLRFTTNPNFGGLRAEPGSGDIGPGATTTVRILLNTSGAPEKRDFVSLIQFAGTGGSQTVTVTTPIVRRPPSISDGGNESKAQCQARSVNDGCSTQVVRAPGQSACSGPWKIRVNATDDPAGVKSVTARLTRGGAAPTDVQLAKEASGSGWFADQAQLPAGTTVKFKVSATDNLDAVTPDTATSEQTVTC